MVQDHRHEYASGWQATQSLAPKFGVHPMTLHEWVKRAEIEPGQYLSIRYTERLAEAGINASVGSRGDSYDNAAAASFNSLYKSELIHKRGPWTGLEHVEHATLDYVEWFNNCRLHRMIGDVPPAEYEAAYYHQRHRRVWLRRLSWASLYETRGGSPARWARRDGIGKTHAQHVPAA
jgi:hypothetical protein